jgi:hypothetical protein
MPWPWLEERCLATTRVRHISLRSPSCFLVAAIRAVRAADRWHQGCPCRAWAAQLPPRALGARQVGMQGMHTGPRRSQARDEPIGPMPGASHAVA